MSRRAKRDEASERELSPAEARWSAAFRRSLPQTLELDLVTRTLLDLPFEAPVCLDVGFGNPVSSRQLRRIEGSWHSLALNARDQGETAEILDEAVGTPDAHGGWPYEDKQFDVIVVAHSVLVRAGDDLALIQECHRVLKTTGHLVVCVEHAKPFGLARLMRRLMRAGPSNLGWSRPGYSEAETFGLMKNGFDVLSVRSFCRLFVELVRVWQEGSLQKGRRRRHQVGRWADGLYRLAFQLDLFLFLTRGHILVVHGRRRQWRPRQAPILNDGRSISEAVLHRPAR